MIEQYYHCTVSRYLGPFNDLSFKDIVHLTEDQPCKEGEIVINNFKIAVCTFVFIFKLLDLDRKYNLRNETNTCSSCVPNSLCWEPTNLDDVRSYTND